MGIFGKILIVLNLLAMGGVAYLASLDWAKRQEWAFAALSHEIKVEGLPVEGPNPPPADLDQKEYAPFVFNGESGQFTEIKRTDLGKIIPPGGEPWGSAVVASQEEEVKRLEGVVFGLLERAASAADRRNLLATFLLNLAETGEERDGIYALLSGISNPNTALAARAELTYLAPGPSQQSGLSALLAVSEYQYSLRAAKKTDESGPLREAARNALIRLAVADLPYTLSIRSAGTRQDRYKAQQEATNERSKPALLNLIQASLRANATEQELQPLRDAVRDKGADDREKAQLLRIAQIAGNLLDSDPKIADALNQISELIVERGESDAEKKAISELIPLVRGTVADKAIDSAALTVGQSLLRLRFSDAQLPIAKPGPVSDLTGKPVQTESEKRERIAHILYHIDADQNWSNRATWQRRVAVIVGINAYAETVEAQATRLYASIQRVEQLILNEQNVFESKYATLVREAQYLADVLNTVEGQLTEQKRVVDEYQTDVNQRTGERDMLSANLADARKEARKSLTNFKQKQEELLEATKKLRLAQDSIGKLESDIRRLEAEVIGSKNVPENKGKR